MITDAEVLNALPITVEDGKFLSCSCRVLFSTIVNAILTMWLLMHLYSNALCVISTSEVDATEAATTTTPATDAIMTTENSSTNASLSESSLTTSTILNESPCVQGKCLNFAGTCAREVICMTHPCDEIECNPDQECIANLCGGCNAFCSGGVTEAPTDAPSEVLIPASTLASPLVTPMPVESGPEPVQVVDEIVSPSSSPVSSLFCCFWFSMRHRLLTGKFSR